MGSTTPLHQMWPRYYQRGFTPKTKVDHWRRDALAGKWIGPATDHSTGAHLSGVVTEIERLGYDVERDATPKGARYRIRNLDHRPTREQFDALRARKNGTGAVATTNGHARRPASLRSLAAMLPALGDDLAVTVVGFDRDGDPTLVLTSAEGWRYSCTVNAADAPRADVG